MEIPNTLDEAIELLDKLISPADKEMILDRSEDKFTASLCFINHSLGRQIRNKWKLWDTSEDNKLVLWFSAQGIIHADDMSGIILTSYYRKKHNLPIELEEQIYKIY